MSIVLYPHDSLRAKTEYVPVNYIKTHSFKRRISAMFRDMYRTGGVGLAAPQVGWNVKIIVGNPNGRSNHETDAFVLINPSIIPFGDDVTDIEGCLSVPGVLAPITRKANIRVKTLNLNGEEVELETSGFTSRIIQHEYDHLNGILFIDKLDTEEFEKIRPTLENHVKRIERLREERVEELKEKEVEELKKQVELDSELDKHINPSQKDSDIYGFVSSFFLNNSKKTVSQRSLKKILKKTIKKIKKENRE